MCCCSFECKLSVVHARNCQRVVKTSIINTSLSRKEDGTKTFSEFNPFLYTPNLHLLLSEIRIYWGKKLILYMIIIWGFCQCPYFLTVDTGECEWNQWGPSSFWFCVNLEMQENRPCFPLHASVLLKISLICAWLHFPHCLWEASASPPCPSSEIQS